MKKVCWNSKVENEIWASVEDGCKEFECWSLQRLSGSEKLGATDELVALCRFVCLYYHLHCG